MKATIALATGTVLTGRSFGAPGERCAELVFNTSMTGYQEILTDPSYKGQAVVMTAPMIGTYGIMPEAEEAVAPCLEGLIVREACTAPSHWNSREPLGDYLTRHGVFGVTGIDTRALVRQIRSAGLLHACLATGDVDAQALVAQAQAFAGLDGLDTVQHVTTGARYMFSAFPAPGAPRIAVIDCGVKRSMLRMLAAKGCAVEVFPAHTPADVIRASRPDGLLVSNGPGDPGGHPGLIATLQGLIGHLPIFGICLGHQLLALALGAKTYKLPFGHHGGNHPVIDLRTGRVEITSQNHNFAVDAASLADVLEVTHTNLYDGSVEGMRHRTLPILSVQYHPEAAPGPHDAIYLFDEFLGQIGRASPAAIAG